MDSQCSLKGVIGCGFMGSSMWLLGVYCRYLDARYLSKSLTSVHEASSFLDQRSVERRSSFALPCDSFTWKPL